MDDVQFTTELFFTYPLSLPCWLQDWEWSPAAPDATLAAYQAEQGNLPARVVLMKLPSREELRQKNLFSVAGEQRMNCLRSGLASPCIQAHGCCTASV